MGGYITFSRLVFMTALSGPPLCCMKDSIAGPSQRCSRKSRTAAGCISKPRAARRMDRKPDSCGTCAALHPKQTLTQSAAARLMCWGGAQSGWARRAVERSVAARGCALSADERPAQSCIRRREGQTIEALRENYRQRPAAPLRVNQPDVRKTRAVHDDQASAYFKTAICDLPFRGRDDRVGDFSKVGWVAAFLRAVSRLGVTINQTTNAIVPRRYDGARCLASNALCRRKCPADCCAHPERERPSLIWHAFRCPPRETLATDISSHDLSRLWRVRFRGREPRKESIGNHRQHNPLCRHRRCRP